MSIVYDCLLIGSGPATLFCAMELVRRDPSQKVLLLERARRLNDSRNVSNGWMGGCARATINLFLTPGFGGEVTDQATIDGFRDRFIAYSDIKPKIVKNRINKKTIRRMIENDVELVEPEMMPVSEDRMIKFADAIYTELKDRATVIHKTDIEYINQDKSGFIIGSNQGIFQARRLLLGTGRGGARWLSQTPHNLNLSSEQGTFDFGVRLEFPASSMAECLDRTSGFQLRFGDFKTSVATTHGAVETEETNHVKISNGRQSSLGRNSLCNFSLLQRFVSPNAHQDIYRLAEIVNILFDGQLMREPISRLLNGTSQVSPLKEFKSLRQGLVKLTELFPALADKCAVYGPEARLNSVRYNLSRNFETETSNLYIIGDMSGRTNSFVQAACSGLLAAEDILEKDSL